MNLIPLNPAHNVIDENEQDLIAIAVSSEQVDEGIIHSRYFKKKSKAEVLQDGNVSISDEDDEDSPKASVKNQVLTQVMNTDFLCIDTKTKQYRWVNITDITFISFVIPIKKKI